MKNILLLTYCCFFLIACDSCKNPDDNEIDCIGLNKPMPDATTTGKNTFGCKINGETWVAYTDSFGALTGGDKKLSVRYSEFSKSARIVANKNVRLPNCDTIRQNFILQILNAGENLITEFSDDSNFTNRHTGEQYKIDTSYLNSISITKANTQDKILSGRFEVRFVSDDGMDTILFNKGRFDAPYTPL